MEQLLEFSRGPLFRLTFAIMVLGLIRILALDLLEMYKAYRRAGDKTMQWGTLTVKALGWLFPVKKLFKNRPVYSIFSFLFHIGLLLVPIFLLAHVRLWQDDIGVPWLTLSYGWSYGLTLLTIVTGVALLVGRAISKSSSFISRKQDFLWPIILLIPFITGFACAHMGVGPKAYQFFMLVHILSGELIFILIPFTKIAHCVLMPVSQFVAAIAWKFPPDTDEKVCVTLNKKGEPV